MALRVEKVDGTPERRVVIGMIVSRTVLGPIADRWHSGLFASKYANLIGGWCVHHYKQYRDAPGAAIEDYYQEWASTGGKDAEVTAAIENLLRNLSHEAVRLKREVSPEYLLDVAGTLFERVSLKQLSQQIDANLDRGEIEEARLLVERSRKVEVGQGSGVSVLTDETAMEAAFSHRHDVLVKCPKALGEFYATALGRGKFVAFVAKPKGGKSYFIRDIAWRAVEQGLRVVHFEMGDDPQEDVLLRFAERATGKCARPDLKDPSRSERYARPVSLISNGDESPTPEVEWGCDDPILDAKQTMKYFRSIGADERFRLSCHPAGTLSISGAEAILDRWERDRFVPDVVCFDYADIAKPMDPRADKLEQIFQTWMAMRSLSQRLHCLVVTATQCNRDGFAANVLTREHVGGDYRKITHVTDMVGINQTKGEKDKGLFRLNRLAGRQLNFGEKKYLWCASQLSTSMPVVHCTF